MLFDEVIKKRYACRKFSDYKIIKRSKYFDSKWYKKNYSVKGDAVKHYAVYGAKAGYNTFWESDFSRDYFHPARKDIVVIAYELDLRGYAVTWMGFNFDESCIDPTDDYYAAFDVFIKDNQIENFCDAISEVIIDYVSFTSRFDEVVNLRKRIIEEEKKDESIRKDASQILFEMEGENELSNSYCIAYRKDTKTDSTPICSGLLKDVAQKLKA